MNKSIKQIHKTSIRTQNNRRYSQTFSLAVNLTGYVNIGNQKKRSLSHHMKRAKALSDAVIDYEK